MARLIHLSDLHFGDSVLSWQLVKTKGRLFSKQSLGLVNHLTNQNRSFSSVAKEKMIAQLCQMDWDLMVISGDLVHLATLPEFEIARRSLEPLIKKGPVLFTAGNHDRYTPEAWGRMEQVFGDCYPFNQSDPVIFEGPGDWGVIELPMSRPSGLWAKGKFSSDLKAYRELILSRQGKPTLLYGHYPLFHPPGYLEGFGHRLWKLKEVRSLTQLPGVKAYLHGHIHQSWAFEPELGQGFWSVNAGGSLKSGYWSIELTETGVSPLMIQPPF